MAAQPDARPGESPALDGREDGERAGRIAGEQAALRRVATLVARAAPPEEVFAAVAAEAGRLLSATHATLSRHESDDAIRVVASWSGGGTAVPVGTRMRLGGRNVHTLVARTGRAARLDDYADVSGAAAGVTHEFGIRAAVAAPVSAEGQLWGMLTVASTHGPPLPADTEARLAGFTELAATAIANAQARAELRSFGAEQAALQRVATLVAQGVPPVEVFSAVSTEASGLFGSGAAVLRFDYDGPAIVFVGVSSGLGIRVGTRWEFRDEMASSEVYRTGRSARVDAMDWSSASGPVAATARRLGVVSTVCSPLVVQGRLWGAMTLSSMDQLLPTDTEERLEKFTELVATAIANAQAREELGDYAAEQAALRRVAVLVARGAPPDEVFAAVAAEAGRVLAADTAGMARYDPDGSTTYVGMWGSTGAAPVPAGTRMPPDGRNVPATVFQTGRPARIDDYVDAMGPTADLAREWGLRSVVGVPVIVADRLWGVMAVGSTRGPLPADTETRLAAFTELVGTALANAEAQAALIGSRARIVATADATRRRIERDLHDGVQQRLVSVAMHLRAVQAAQPAATELAQQLDRAVTEVNGALDELREIARGIHPAILADGGLRPALKTLARRSAVPVRLHVPVAGRLPDAVEIAAYYAVCEALANTAKHAHASVIDIQVETGDGVLDIHVHDDGRGSADFGHGSGLVGLKDRIEALGGRLSLHSPPGAGTTMQITLPLAAP